MDTASFYVGGASVTNRLNEPSFTATPIAPVQLSYDNSSRSESPLTPGSIHGHLYPYSNPRPVHPPDELFTINQKLDRVLAMFMEQKSAVTQKEKEMNEQLAIVSADISQIKKELQAAETTPQSKGKKRVPKDISVSYMYVVISYMDSSIIIYTGKCKKVA